MMKHVKRLCLLTGVFALALSAAGPADLFPGTWKMNVAKSEFKARPDRAPKSSVHTYKLEGDWIVSKSESVDADGKKSTRTNRARMDGKEYPMEGASGTGTIRLQPTGARSFTSVSKFGTGTITTQYTFSADGKTRTQTAKGTNSSGEPVSNTIVYEKQ
jgi:hypothetical protein